MIRWLLMLQNYRSILSYPTSPTLPTLRSNLSCPSFLMRHWLLRLRLRQMHLNFLTLLTLPMLLILHWLPMLPSFHSHHCFHWRHLLQTLRLIQSCPNFLMIRCFLRRH